MSGYYWLEQKTLTEKEQVALNRKVPKKPKTLETVHLRLTPRNKKVDLTEFAKRVLAIQEIAPENAYVRVREGTYGVEAPGLVIVSHKLESKKRFDARVRTIKKERQAAREKLKVAEQEATKRAKKRQREQRQRRRQDVIQNALDLPIKEQRELLDKLTAKVNKDLVAGVKKAKEKQTKKKGKKKRKVASTWPTIKKASCVGRR